MEFLDPKKRQAHLIRLFVGYILIGAAVILTTIILLYQAYGFGLKNGEVIQNGLIFISSSPGGANILVNGTKRPETTNSRLLLPAGQYSFELQRDGYRPWKRAVNLEGGTVQRFDYPVLFPTKLTTTAAKRYDLKPTILTESPDRRWVFVQDNTAYNVFDVFDSTKLGKDPVTVTIPTTLSTLAGTSSWKFVEWSNDNSHVLLQHIVTDAAGKQTSEYIMANRENPDQSVNLTTTLGINPTKIELRDKKYDQYFIYTQDDHKLQTASISQPKPQALLEHVLDYKTYGANMVLYAADQGAPAGKALIKLQDNDQSYTLRTVTLGSTYMLELTQYAGDWYMVAGAPSETATYIYKNPVASLAAQPSTPLTPVQVLKTANPNFVSFSDNARFIMAENGQQFSVFDAENDKGYTYTSDAVVDAPQPHATWMDGNRLTYVSNGKIIVFDYDNTNRQTLVNSDALYGSAFDRDYKVLYALGAQTAKDAAGKDTTQYVLTSTPLRTPQDQ